MGFGSQGGGSLFAGIERRLLSMQAQGQAEYEDMQMSPQAQDPGYESSQDGSITDGEDDSQDLEIHPYDADDAQDHEIEVIKDENGVQYFSDCPNCVNDLKHKRCSDHSDSEYFDDDESEDEEPRRKIQRLSPPRQEMEMAPLSSLLSKTNTRVMMRIFPLIGNYTSFMDRIDVRLSEFEQEITEPLDEKYEEYAFY